MIVQNLAVQRGQWLSFLCCYVILRDGENNVPFTLLKIYTEFNTKCACTNETAARNLCNKRLGVLCKGLSLNCFSRSFVMKPIGLFNRGGRVPKKFLFWKAKKNHVFCRSAFRSTLLKHAVEIFFVLRNADFSKFKNASEHSWGKVLLIRVLYREKIMHHGWSVTLTYCYIGLPIWIFWSQILKFWLFWTPLAFTGKQKSQKKSVFFQSERLVTGKTLSELHIHYKSLLKRIYNHAGCTKYWKYFTVALRRSMLLIKNKCTTV